MTEDGCVLNRDGDVVVTLRLKGWEAYRLADALGAVADRHDTSQAESKRWRRVAAQLTRLSEPRRRYLRKQRPARPPNTHENELDMDHVLNGPAPYPVLSVRDMRTVWPALEAKGLNAKEIGNRLHVHERTVYHWRKAAKRRKGQQ